MTTEKLLSIEDLCRELRIHRCTLYDRIKKRGVTLSLKVGRRVYFHPSVLNSLLALPG
jgi:hypothetical protein